MRRRVRRGKKKRGKSENTVRTQDYGQRSLPKSDTIVGSLASNGAEKSDITTMAPKDVEGKPFPN